MDTEIVEYWIVQNTGYSAGLSWFDTRPPDGLAPRFDSEAAARTYYRAKHWGDRAVKWRLVHVRMESTPDQRVTTERFIALRGPRRTRQSR